MKNLFFFAILSTSLTSFSQKFGAIGSFNWPSFPAPTIPDSLKSEPVFYLLNTTTYDFTSSFETEIVLYKRVYINSAEKAEEYSQQQYSLNDEGTLTILNARVLHESGSVDVLAGEQIIETKLELKNKFNKETMRKLQLLFPNVKKGDILEIAFEISVPRPIISREIYLEDDLPSLSTRVALRNMAELDLTVYSLNGMPSTGKAVEGGVNTIYWEKKGVRAMIDGGFNAIRPNSPYGVYALWRKNEALDYRTYYNFVTEDFPDNYSSGRKIEPVLLEMGAFTEADPPLIQLQKMIRFFESDFEWISNSGTSNINQSMSFLDKKQIDATLFLRYVLKFLKEKKMNYERGFSKSLLDGRFENGLVSIAQMDRRYLVIYGDNPEEMHFLFTPWRKNSFYYLDEIPFYVEGNQSVALRSEKDMLKEILSIQLPEGNHNSNTHFGRVIVDYNPETNTSSAIRKDNLKGNFSYLARNYMSDSWLNDWGISPDSVKIEPKSIGNVFPYDLTYESDTIRTELFELIDDSLVWLNLESLLPKGIYFEDEEKETVGEYLVLPYHKTHDISLFIQSPSPIELAEKAKSISKENSVGMIKVECSQPNPTILKFNFKVIIKDRYITPDQIEDYKELTSFFAEVKGKKWTVQNKNL